MDQPEHTSGDDVARQDASQAMHAARNRDDFDLSQPIMEETHLLIIESPYRSLLRPLLAYIDTIKQRHPDDTLTVILPEYVVIHWWEYFLHNQTGLRLKAALLFRPGIVVIDIPEHLRDRHPADRVRPGDEK